MTITAPSERPSVPQAAAGLHRLAETALRCRGPAGASLADVTPPARPAAVCAKCRGPLWWVDARAGAHCWECLPPPTQTFVRSAWMVVRLAGGAAAWQPHGELWIAAGPDAVVAAVAVAEPGDEDWHNRVDSDGTLLTYRIGHKMGVRRSDVGFDVWWNASPLLDVPRRPRRR